MHFVCKSLDVDQVLGHGSTPLCNYRASNCVIVTSLTETNTSGMIKLDLSSGFATCVKKPGGCGGDNAPSPLNI